MGAFETRLGKGLPQVGGATNIGNHEMFNEVVPFALETYGILSARSDRLLVECASLASRACRTI